MSYYIVDTTLRDGEQTPGLLFNLEQKCRTAAFLDSMGVHQIEAGTPAMGGEEKESVKAISAMNLHAKVSAWNRMHLQDLEHSFECNPDIIHFSVPISDIHIHRKLNKDIDWVLNKMMECIQFCHQHGYETTVGFEDASRAETNQLLRAIETALSHGITRIRYSDTVGCLVPEKIVRDIRLIRQKFPVEVEIHAHNDFDMAIANSIAAYQEGALYINTTLGGIGERSGNCDYFGLLHAMSFIPAI